MNIHLITEIPGPYRNPHFAELERQFNERGHQFLVHFMAEDDDIRPASWFDKSLIRYSHRFHKTKTLRLGRRKIYWNPTIIKDIRKEKPDLIITGGLWSSVTCFLLIVFWPKDQLVGWTELNEHVHGVSNPFTRFIRKWLLKRPIALGLPGKSAEKYLDKVLQIDPKSLRIVPFPNLIDESLFCTENDSNPTLRNELNLKKDCKIALWPARLEPEKGIEQFLPLLTKEMLTGWHIILIGQGSRKEIINKMIRQLGIEEFIEIRQYVSPSEMPKYYKSVDLLLLPSLRDPNPLSVIESLRMGLPMLISDAVGNHYEALSNKNGWLLPLALQNSEKRKILSYVFSTNPGDLKIMGQNAKKVYAQYWELAPACNRTVSSIGELLKRINGKPPVTGVST